MKFIIKTLNLFLLMGSVAWLCLAPGWEPGIVTLGFLAALLEQERRDHFKLSDWDQNLIKKFRRELPSDSCAITHLRDFDMALSFHRDQFFTPLCFWWEKWKADEYRFKNRKLEKRKLSFFEAVDTFTSDVSLKTFPIRGNPEFSSMEYSDFNNSPEKEEIRRKLNKNRRKAYLAYSDFIAEIKKKS